MSIYHSVIGTYKFCIFGYYTAIIAQILTNFFLFSYKFDRLISFFKKRDVSDHQF